MPPEILTNKDYYLDAKLRSHNGLAIASPDMPANLASLFAVLGGRAERHRAYAEANLYSLRPRSIRFGFVDENDVYAMAFAAEGTGHPPFDFIGINVGTPITLLANFRQMLSRRNVFPDVGDASLEAEDIPPMETLTTNAALDQADAVEPRCPVRYLFAQYLAYTAFDFLYFHEQTHLRNGHFELWNQRGGGGALLEVAGHVTDGGHRNKLRRTIETDADCGAILWTLNAAHHEGRGRTQSSANFTSDAAYMAAIAMWGSQALVTRSTTFAVYVLCRLFHEDHQKQPPKASEPYPSPAVRFRVVNETMRAILSGNPGFYGFDACTFDGAQFESIAAAEAACATICGRNPNVHEMTAAVDAEFSAFTEEFTSTWAEIRPELERYKRGGNLAP